jgi:outer membrane protein TolC
MRHVLLLAALSLTPWVVPVRAQTQAETGSPVRVYSLEDALRLLRNEPRLQSAEQDVIIAGSRVTEAALRFLPELGLQATASKYNAIYPFSLSENFHNILLFPNSADNIYSSRAYFNLPLYEGQRTLNTYRLAQAALKQAQATLESVKMDLASEVKASFYRLLLAQERAAADEEYQGAVAAALRGGGLNGWETVEAETSLASARARAFEAAHDLQSARLAFLKALNIELDTPFRVNGALATVPVNVDLERSVLWAMELRPELQAQTYKAQMDAIGVNLAFGRRYPTVYVSGDYELTAQRFPLDKNNWDVSLGIKLPLTYDLWSQLTQKRAEQRQGQLARTELQDRVRLEVRQAAEGLRFWQDEFPRREREWRRVESLYEAAAGKAGSTLSRIRAKAGLLDLRVSYLAAVTEHLLARTRLERAVGRELAP